jgi:hypothetical protein
MTREQNVQDLIAATRDLLAENDDLRGQIKTLQDELRTLRPQLAEFEKLLESLSDERGCLLVLQRIAHDERLPHITRMKAAAAALPYERPKLAITAQTDTFSLYDFLEAKRQKDRLKLNPPPPTIDVTPEPDKAS